MKVIALMLILSGSAFSQPRQHSKTPSIIHKQQPISQYMREVGLLYLEQVDSATKAMQEAILEITSVEKMIYGPHSPSTDMDMLFRQRDAALRKGEDAHNELKSMTSIIESRIALTLTDRSRTPAAGDRRLFEIMKLLGLSTDVYDSPGAIESGIVSVQSMCRSSVEISIRDGVLFDPTSKEILQAIETNNKGSSKIDTMKYDAATCTLSDFNTAMQKLVTASMSRQ